MINERRCPKCGGRLYGDTCGYSTHLIVCASCGLSHCVGAQKESLKRQISGEMPRETRVRREAAQGVAV